MATKYNRIGQGGTYLCSMCCKTTRDTGRGEKELDLCARCLFDCYVENAANDYGRDSEQYRTAMENLKALPA